MAYKIFDANDRAREEMTYLGRPYASHRARIMWCSTKMNFQWNGKTAGGPGIAAYIDGCRWLADCPTCGGTEYVTPEDPIFFCHECGNHTATRHALPVEFPPEKERNEIEQLLLARPVDERIGLTPIDKSRLAIPSVPGLTRSWKPGTTVADLRQANKDANL